METAKPTKMRLSVASKAYVLTVSPPLSAEAHNRLANRLSVAMAASQGAMERVTIILDELRHQHVVELTPR